MRGEDRERVLQAAIGEIAKSIVSLMDQCGASQSTTIEIVTMLAERALAENRVDDVRPMVQALNVMHEKSNKTLAAVKELLVALKHLEAGDDDED